MSEVNFTVVEVGDVSTKNRVSCRFDEFNEIRARRSVAAARVFIDQHDGQGEYWIWMSPVDILNNINDFGADEGLNQAMAAYNDYYAKMKKKVVEGKDKKGNLTVKIKGIRVDK